MEAAIATERLTKRYGRARGVTDLTFHVRPGEVFGSLGPNGAGKTTTIRTLLDSIRPTSGTAHVLGLDSHRDRRRIHERVGYLPGEFALYDDLTAREYLQYLANLRGTVERRYVAELAERLGSDLSTRIGSLSHGNKQKLGLIQAFMHRPDVVILDEPTQGLDPLVQQEFHRMVFEARESGQTVYLSSHVLPEVERVCDRVAIIRDGRLIAIEDVGALRARAMRTLIIRFAGPVPKDAFEGLAGVQGLEVAGEVVRCKVKGVMDPVVKAAARFEVIDLESHEPGLEDIFLSLYGSLDASSVPRGELGDAP